MLNQTALFNPSNSAPAPVTPPVAGYDLWLDASNAASFSYSSGTLVSSWVDRSSHAYTFLQNTVANQPSRSGTLNGLSTVVFNGSTNSVKYNGSTGTFAYLNDGTKATIFILAKSATTSQFGTLFGNCYTGAGSVVGMSVYTYTDNNIYFDLTNGTPGHYVETGITNNTSWDVFTIKSDPNNASDALKEPVSVNNGTFVNSTASSWSTASGASDALALGGNPSASNSNFNGQIAEMIIYKGSILSSTDITSTYNYLKTKWGL